MAFFLPLPLLLWFSSVIVAQQLCNGNAAYCDRIYSNVSEIGAHDSAFVGALPQDNQDVSVTAQLNAGIRFLQGQTHKDPFGTLSLCHTTCYEEDAGSLKSYLATVKSWLDKNPNEVLTLLLVNGDSLDVSVFDSTFSSSGIKPYTYTPSTSPNILGISAWPTLRNLISADSGANPSKEPYILDEFSYFFETPYDTTDPAFPECTLDRPPNSSPDGKMYIINHFLDVSIFGLLVPDRSAAAKTNAATGSGSIGAQAQLCEGIYGRAPKGVLVDFFDAGGQVFNAQDSLNRV
ncbi:hypothetical protein MMC09_003398 [Bachmanniomyces sp. S44760]|nr:hypothetical protein [Bachmanniomyces sp. S44760]